MKIKNAMDNYKKWKTKMEKGIMACPTCLRKMKKLDEYTYQCQGCHKDKGLMVSVG